MQLSLPKKILRISLVILALAGVITLVYFILVWTGMWEKLNSVDKFRKMILSLGFWGRFAFVFFQFLQVTLIPIPSPILIIAGSIIYSPFQSTILSLAGILLGSAFAFFLGRVFGYRLVKFMVGQESAKKWKTFLNNCKFSFVLMMLLPCFPDDILCLVAGLTNMTWGFFMTTQFIARPIGIFLVSYFSSGEIIPYHGWGLIVWGVIIVLSLVLIYLSSKYSQNIENFMQKSINKITKKDDKK